MKHCPFCAEEIQDAAIVCRFCNADLRTNTRAVPANVVVQPQPGAPSPSPGVAAVLSLVIPGAGQMYRGNVGQGLAWLVAVVLGYLFLIAPGLVLHVICVVTAATVPSSHLRTAAAPAPPLPVMPPQPHLPVPLWQKVVVGGLVVLVLGGMLAGAIVDRASSSRVDNSKYDALMSNPARQNRTIRFNPVAAHIARDGDGWVLTSESTVAWHDCLVVLSGREYEIPKIYARDVIRVERAQWSAPPAEGSEGSLKVVCATQAPN